MFVVVNASCHLKWTINYVNDVLTILIKITFRTSENTITSSAYSCVFRHIWHTLERKYHINQDESIWGPNVMTLLVFCKLSMHLHYTEIKRLADVCDFKHQNQHISVIRYVWHLTHNIYFIFLNMKIVDHCTSNAELMMRTMKNWNWNSFKYNNGPAATGLVLSQWSHLKLQVTRSHLDIETWHFSWKQLILQDIS